MRILEKVKDGGPESPVDAYFLIESKRFGSIALLKFNKGRREAYHTHAFNAWTWFLGGCMWEQTFQYGNVTSYRRALKPKVTKRKDNHRVIALEDSWAFTIRGPWADTWTEDTATKHTVFTHGRKEI